jgi:hypothetical protein
MFFCLGADLERLQTKIGKGADIHVIDPWMPAYLFVTSYEFAAILSRKLFAGLLIDICTDCQLVPDVPVRLRVFV